MNGPLLEVRDLRAAVGDLDVVRGISFGIAPGETVGLVGESGSGKTFTALSVMGLLPDAARVTGGSIAYEGRDILRLPERERRSLRGAGIAMIHQEPLTALNPLMRVGAQIIEGLRAHGVPRAEARRRMLDTLDEVGLPTPDRTARRYPHQLSGGQRQRIVIAMALAPRPRLLIADEPTTALDATVQQQILAQVDRLRRDHDLAVLWITHDLGVVARLTRRVLVMYAGRIVEDAPVRALYADPRHPYSAGLIASLPPAPAPDGTPAERTPLPAIGGTPPDLAALPPGCPFAPRCPQRADRCTTEEPPLTDRTACWVPKEKWT
ncbi:Oligopeptide transport ATP-binding protein OppD [Streptomyces sp. RB5]|uniref:Oligopeptide transport ATP-binding protein OppD n=1 Tax=Streptomyces smaragdinus TaxID=2585196 RepID=A0A7K0CSM3_9ACTN|nr:ABC transporter ATP-binding protein [Streptomyces smaragdinus]MQY16451.1 Oligopeptide transport ATP-binding protein OppD [Streptomyces smaragdinus]